MMLGQAGLFVFVSRFWGLFGILSPVLFAGSIYVVERRGKRERVHPQRQVDISSLLESIPEAALIVDTEHRIIDANSTAAQILGVTREELVGSPTRQVGHALADLTNGGHGQPAVLTRALRGEAVRHERRIVHHRKTDQNLELPVSATPMKNERGEVIAALVIARDITELHALQRRIDDVERHLAIGQMAASLAHDFNNILAAIEQAAYILQTSPASAEERKSVAAIIQNAVRRGAEIIAGVREYLRTGSGALGKVDMRQIMTEAVELTRPLWTKAGIRMTCDLQPVPDVRANSADMRRVFTNLIINATDAMNQPGGQIMVTCQERDGQVVATVADTGKGISLEVRNKVFFPYFTTKQKGTGLGLSGAQKIVLSQGGNINFRTEVGKGTTFYVTMPKANDKIVEENKTEKVA
jgi:PAS domain S-box-containing protein